MTAARRHTATGKQHLLILIILIMVSDEVEMDWFEHPLLVEIRVDGRDAPGGRICTDRKMRSWINQLIVLTFHTRRPPHVVGSLVFASAKLHATTIPSLFFRLVAPQTSAATFFSRYLGPSSLPAAVSHQQDNAFFIIFCQLYHLRPESEQTQSSSQASKICQRTTSSSFDIRQPYRPTSRVSRASPSSIIDDYQASTITMIGTLTATMPVSPTTKTLVEFDGGCHDDRDDDEDPLLLLHRHNNRDRHLNCTSSSSSPFASPPLLPLSARTRRRRLPSSCSSSFASCSGRRTPAAVWLVVLLLAPLCRSEAFAARSAFFGRRSMALVRGGSSETKSSSSSQQPSPPPLTCVMQAPPSAVNGYNNGSTPDDRGADFHNQHQHHQLNSKKKLGKKLSLSKLPPPPPFATTTTSQQPWRQNTQQSSKQLQTPLPKQSQTDHPLEFVAETRLPTKLGEFRLRAYRRGDAEPCVIYSAHHPLQNAHDNNADAALPVRVHDQCMTSEVFGSQRYVSIYYLVWLFFCKLGC
jgi:hypothetical protein